MALLNPYLGIRILECVLGIVCFGLFTYYGLLAKGEYSDTIYKNRVKGGIDFVAADAFPFIVQIPYLIASFYHGRKFNHNILNPMMALSGCVVYLTAGAMSIRAINGLCIRDCFNYLETQDHAVGSMFIVTGCIYMIDLIFWCVKLRRDRGNDVD